MAKRVIFGHENRANLEKRYPGEEYLKSKPNVLLAKDYHRKAYAGTETSDLASGSLAPTITADWMIDRIRWQNKLRSICNTMFMPSKTLTIPQMTSGDTVYYQLEGYNFRTESGLDNASSGYTQPTIGTQTLRATKMAGITGWTTELAEDSVIPVPEMMFSELADSMADYEELAMIQGDYQYGNTIVGAVGGGFADYATANVGDVRYMFDGLLVLTPGTNTKGTYGTADDTSPVNDIDGGDDKLTKEELDQLLAVIENSNFTCDIMFMRSNVAARLRNTTEYEEFQRLDAIGDRAALIKGYVGTFYTADIFRTTKIPVGQAFGTSTDSTCILGFDKSQPLIGDRRRINFMRKHRFEIDADEIRVTERYGFICKHNEGLGVIWDVEDSA